MNIKTIIKIASSALLLGLASTSFAIPNLQIDIDGASYEGGSEESVVTTDTVFDLYALGTPSGNVSTDDILNSIYYLSIAIIPQIGPDPVDFGSFTVDGTSYDVGDMVFGTPPIDAYDGSPEAGLGTHSVYDTFYMQIVVNFVSDAMVGTYNVQDEAGAIQSYLPGTGSYYDAFEIDISGMLAGFDLHFDLYDTVVANGRRGDLGDLDEGIFAPFSHDARTRGECCTTTVPEPGTLALFGLGLLGTGFSRRLRRFAR